MNCLKIVDAASFLGDNKDPPRFVLTERTDFSSLRSPGKDRYAAFLLGLGGSG